jgi:hypothetical protein
MNPSSSLLRCLPPVQCPKVTSVTLRHVLIKISLATGQASHLVAQRCHRRTLMYSMEAAPCRLSPSKTVAAPETESKHSPIFGRLRIARRPLRERQCQQGLSVAYPTGRFPTVIIGGRFTHNVLLEARIGKWHHRE